jgi:hypothetical protein
MDDQDVIELDPRDFCSANGFEQGMRLSPLRSRVFRRDLVLIDARDLLRRVLVRDVWPQLDHAGLRLVPQRHSGNPLRVARVDGRLLRPEEVPATWPESIRVPSEVIEQLVLDLGMRWIDRSRIDESIEYTFLSSLGQLDAAA